MRIVFGALLVLHALAHALAFASTLVPGERWLPAALRGRISAFDNGELGPLLLGLCWAALSVGLTVAGCAAWFATAWWPALAAATLIASLCLSLSEWTLCAAARFGALVNVLLLTALWSSHLLDLVL